ncbi:uncharacterized protein LOC131428987 [Malaya genurostris]|uniref:uncharacterized protein LOC131428987 n=1 Tax=Malaya genurostris TaxID=325434 RepID=UPI0026F3D89A|nr:uncharacterized protein LOC131428987 [Malaya genurostris]
MYILDGFNHRPPLDNFTTCYMEDNPADRISRGADPQQLLEDTAWWHGPPCLFLPPEDWPDSIVPLSSSMVEQQNKERKLTIVAFHAHAADNSLIVAYSELAPLLKVTAYCKRFADNCRVPKVNSVTGGLTVEEYDNALKSLIHVAQQASFSAERQYLHAQEKGIVSLKNAPFKSSIKNLDLFFDSRDLLRINGRLSMSPGSYDCRYPIILPANHHLTKLIARSIHHQALHVGHTQLLSTMKQRFWPVRGRDLARSIVHHCVTWFRCRPKPSDQYMAPLPVDRITPSKVFENTGLDYCGPFFVRRFAGRGASVKVWVAVYVCFAVKAVMLDIVAGMSADACVNSLRRFVSRVGRVRVIHCDNSTSLVSASREMKEMRKQFIEQLESTHWANECLNLWKRWSKEYISLLHQRPSKWRKIPTDFMIGSMILLKQDNTPPKQWPLGRVIAIYPSEDGIVRVVDVRTQAGIRRRATTELCLLPLDDSLNEDCKNHL